MPLEISEIAVRLAVGDAAAPTTPPGPPTTPATSEAPSREVIDQVVRTCVTEVLRALRSIGER